MTFKDNSKQINEKMSKHLKTIRLEEKFTMRQMSSFLDVAHSFIGKTEQQHRRLDVGEFIEYCRAMGRDPVTELRVIANL